jgi:UDP-GlcNAc:undecaprenyl-phosphate GlcNAc-1-phosphate transferase
VIGAVVALVVTAVTAPLARRLGLLVGALDFPSGGLKPHAQPVSYLGGLAVMVGVAAGMAAAGWPFPWVLPVAVFGIGIVGLADDVGDLPPALRLLLQLGIGALLAWRGLGTDPFDVAVLGWVVAILLFAGTVNAVNMVDGMDGLASTTAAVSALGLYVIAWQGGRAEIEVLPVILAGAAIGFLPLNLPSARLFLGNSGAYLLGGTLAVVILNLGQSLSLLIGAGTCLGFFALDLLASLIRRTLRGDALLGAYRNHLYDQLLARGLSVSRCLAVCVGIHAGLVAVGVVAAATSSGIAVAIAAVAWLGALVGLGVNGFISRS